MRTFAITAVAVVGMVMSAVGAAAFNLAGLYWHGSSFGHALYWEPVESGITVAFGCVMLFGWLISVVSTFLIPRVRVSSDMAPRARVVGTWCAAVSVVVGIVFLYTALIGLPAQYDWIRY